MRIIILLSLLNLAACSVQKKTNDLRISSPITVNGKLFTSAYMQKAAEYRALCFQAYNIARIKLDEKVTLITNKPKAIITDIDETVLDNSAFAVHQALQGKDYDQIDWYSWTAREEADTIPGAPSFLKYAGGKGIQIFYITNREERERKSTLINLQRYYLPNADNEHLIMRINESGKEHRRQHVMADYEVVLLLGDNLADFSTLFDKQTTDQRITNTNKIAEMFGDRYIVLPNPDYGDWESAIYQYNYKLTPLQKDSSIKSILKTY
ncbi:MAG TPA: 5'-nucleotidase, lipoprotein e(P4) family [Flavisolibacter sp.]|nr:5'-nucleotidase, lipoprotein e(P4) family [Flavisolibacter sp.]